MFRTYGIGDAERNNGVLILISEEDRKIRIEVGYGLEGVINDSKAGRILDDYVVPYLKDDLWDDGILNCFNAVVKYIQKEYDVDCGANEPLQRQGEPFFSTLGGHFVITCGISIAVGIVIYEIFKDDSLVPIMIWIAITFAFFFIEWGIWYALADILSTGFTTLIGYAIVYPDDGSSYGGYSSSGSSRSSSSGSSGRSGGGGSSGGGGASRSF